MFITHLKKQTKFTQKSLFPSFDLISEQEKLKLTLSGTLSETERDLGLMGMNSISGIYFRLASENMASSYDASGLNFEAFSKGLSYGVLAKKVDPIQSNSVVTVGRHIAYLIMGRVCNCADWVDYALPKLRSFQSMKGGGMPKLLEQFPMFEFICDDNPTAEKAHKFLKKVYEIDSLKEPHLAYRALVDDHIKYTKLLKDVYTSIYASEPLNFLPLEIVYLSLFIQLPLEDELIGIRDGLRNMEIVKDAGILALEKYVEAIAP